MPLTDARGQEWTFVEKVPVVSAEHLTAESPYPRPGVIACCVVGRQFGADGIELIVIGTEEQWHIMSVTSETQFIVRSDQLLQIDRDVH